MTTRPTPCVCDGTGLVGQPVWESAFARQLRQHEAQEQLFQRMLTITSRSSLPQGRNSRQAWKELIAWTTVDGTPVSNTTTEAIIFPDNTVPANYMQYGRALQIMASGKLSTTATPTMTWALRWGGVSGTILATTPGITMGSGMSNVCWRLEGELQCRTDGPSGSLLFLGQLTVNTSATAVAQVVFSVAGYNNPAAVTVNLIADTALSLTADWSAASASNTLTGMEYYLNSMN